jgi:uncharacterized repeat protein (TIGR03803 family)
MRKKFWSEARKMGMLAMALMLTANAVAANKYKVLHKFTGNDGANPDKGFLVLDKAGNLYGTTPNGGAFGQGTVFVLKPSSNGTWRERVLHSFSGLSDGGLPLAGLTFGAPGVLYGTTYQGGGAFQLKHNLDGSWTDTVLNVFAGADGVHPDAGLIRDAAGNLYGTTIVGGNFNCNSQQGCGVVFELTPNPDGTWTESVLYTFNGGTDGALPTARLAFDAAGNLYGTTAAGGGANAGTVFRLTPSGGAWIETVLHAFTGGDGAVPIGGLILDATGNLYGTTSSGGSSACGCGVVFKLKHGSGGGWTERLLHSFTGGRDGANPVAGLIRDTAGNLYGAAQFGGAYGDGVVFQLTPTSTGWREKVLHTFAEQPGLQPVGGLTLDKAGNLYGSTTRCGPSYTCLGVIFEITP